MYINEIGGPAKNNQIKKTTKKGEAGSFSGLLSSDEISEGNTTSATLATSGTNNLFLLQEIGEEEKRKQQAIEQSFDVIRYLENIRIGLLTGGVDKSTLLNLEQIVNNIKANLNDPKLNNILNEIELRAKVEIAKYD